jgi:hypothetical protein
MVYLRISAKTVWLWISVIALTALLSILVVPVGLQLFSGRPRARGDELAIIKKRVDPREVQAWAKQMLLQYTNSSELILPNPPKVLRKMSILGRMGPSIAVSPAGPSSNRCVSLLYAESFGFGGDGHIIEVGDDSFKTATNNRCVEWIPGVYYCYVHSP